MATKKSSEAELSAEEEENDMLLYLWQKAAFMDSGQGIPREMADSLRLRVAQLSSYHSKMRLAGRDSFGTEQLLKEHLDRYSQVMDERDESKGMNNFCGTVEALLAGKSKGQRNWKSCLQLSVIQDMPEYKALVKEAERYSDNLSSLERSIPFGSTNITSPHYSQSSSGPPSNSGGGSTPKCPQGVAQRADQGVSNTAHKTQKFQYAHPGIANTTVRGKTSMQGSTSAGYRGVNSPPMKRSRANNDGDECTDEQREVGANAFSTAKDEYVRQQHRSGGGRGGGCFGGRGGGGGTSAFNYGSSKKVLGTRKGASSRFVPPVRKDVEDADKSSSYSSEAEIRSRVLRDGRGDRNTNHSLPPELEGNERLRNVEPRMVELIMNEIMDKSAPVQWSDIAGLEFAKATIKEIVVWPMMRPDLFTGLRGPPKGILLFGPPGTGKTLIGKCIASQVAATFFSISASSLTSKWIGEGEKMVRALFAVARCFQPAVIFMDEIDSLLTQRSDTEHESSRRIKTEFLVQLDGATTSEADRLLVIGATNRPQEIDEAARRRLVKRLYIPLPDVEARKHIVLNLMKQQPFHLVDDQLDLVCTRTEGYSGADMANLCREAAYGPVREAASSIQHISAEEMRKVMFHDFEAALLVIKPSVSEKDLDLYIEWNRQFGAGGK